MIRFFACDGNRQEYSAFNSMGLHQVQSRILKMFAFTTMLIHPSIMMIKTTSIQHVRNFSICSVCISMASDIHSVGWGAS